MRNLRWTRKRMVRLAAILIGALCIGCIASGNTVQSDEYEAKGKISNLEQSSYEGPRANLMCNGLTAQAERRACPARDGTMLALGHNPCTQYAGRCTGSGGRQCVTAPSSQSPDAITVTQCCSGSYQYPWVSVCPGQQAVRGCSFCVF
jgi:hypothetical protein